MRPGLLKRALLVAGCGALSVTWSACESTQDQSAKLGREGTGAAAASTGTLKLGARNRAIRVSEVTLLAGAGRKAVAAKLTSTSSRTQLDVPLLVTVSAPGGKVAYSNGTTGVEELLQRIPVLRPRESAWWVDDQVLTAGATSGVKVIAGTGRNAGSGRTAGVSARGARAGSQGGLSTVDGTLVNNSGKAGAKAAVFAVALRGGKVVAAGRAFVASLPAHAGGSVPFQAFLVGSPAGAKIETTAVAAGS
jgi:hypothetical protein